MKKAKRYLIPKKVGTKGNVLYVLIFSHSSNCSFSSKQNLKGYYTIKTQKPKVTCSPNSRFKNKKPYFKNLSLLGKNYQIFKTRNAVVLNLELFKDKDRNKSHLGI